MAFVLHHIISDDDSLGTLITELFTAYDALIVGLEPTFSSPHPDYFTSAHHQVVVPEDTDRRISYWRSKLEGAKWQVGLPIDYEAPPRSQMPAGFKTMRVGRQAELEALSKSVGASPFMVLLAAWFVTLSAFTGEEDLTVLVPLGQRGTPEAEGVVGMFVRTTPIRLQLSPDNSLQDLVLAVKRLMIEAQAHPLDGEQVNLSVPQRFSANTMVVMNRALPDVHVEGAEVLVTPIWNRNAKFDMTLFLTPHKGDLIADVEYSASAFEGTLPALMLQHMVGLIHDSIRHLDRQVPFSFEAGDPHDGAFLWE